MLKALSPFLTDVSISIEKYSCFVELLTEGRVAKPSAAEDPPCCKENADRI